MVTYLLKKSVKSITSLFIIVLLMQPHFGLANDSKQTTTQDNTTYLTGIVSDESGIPLPGVTVVVKGTSTGTTTDLDGKYSLNVAIRPGTVVYSFIGMTSQEIIISEETTVNVVLVEADIQIKELVVTALGMKREKKSLGYSVQEVSGDLIKESKELNVINALSGKVAGVNITQGGGGVGGGGARIVIRGETSMSGNNTPLYIIDGIPGSSNDVASDDIATITVLKGPSASALYGSRAAAGVILITTKTGRSGSGGSDNLGVEINSNTTFQNPFILPEYQNEFGQGTGGIYRYYNGNNGVWPDGSISNDDYDVNWGPRFDGELREQFNGNEPWVAYPDNVKDFYQTGLILNNNVSVAKAGENGNFRVSYTNVKQKGIVPNNDYNLNRIDLGGGWNLNENISVSSNIKYYKSGNGNNRSTDVRMYPRNIDIAALKEYWVPGLEGIQQMKWRSGTNNPYFDLYENLNKNDDSRLIGNVSTNIKINKNFSFLGRAGLSNTFSADFNQTAFSSVGSNNQYGSFYTRTSNSRELNTDFLFTYQADITEVINVKASAGGNHMRSYSSNLSSNVDQLLIPDVYNLGNYRVYPTTSNAYSNKELNSLYAFANFAYKNMIYFDVTARNDWSSTLPENNNSYFYPSFTLSGLINEIISLPDAISFFKLRSSWARVGNDTSPYSLQNQFSWGTGEGGVATISQSSTKANADLKPELTSAWEIGTDLRFFNNRLGIDLAYYNSFTTNQILKVEVSPTTGYSYILKNAGEINNYGMELMLTYKVVEKKDFTFDLTLNWSRDRSIVVEYDPDSPDAFLSRSVTNHLFVEDRTGERRGALYGKGYKRAPNGEILFTKSGDTQRGEKMYLGNYNPDWMGGLITDFSYKNLSLSALFDLRWGGVFYSRTNYEMNISGLSTETLLGGYDADGNYVQREYIVPDGMIEEDGEYRKLTSQDLIESGLSTGGLTGQQYWENMMDAEIPEAVIYDASYLKFRELKIGYELPKRLLSKSFIDLAKISLVVRNLALWSKIPNVDAEVYSSSEQAGAIPGYDKTGGVPSTRNISVNVNLKF